MTYLQGEWSNKRADSVRRFDVGRVLLLLTSSPGELHNARRHDVDGEGAAG